MWLKQVFVAGNARGLVKRDAIRADKLRDEIYLDIHRDHDDIFSFCFGKSRSSIVDRPKFGVAAEFGFGIEPSSSSGRLAAGLRSVYGSATRRQVDRKSVDVDEDDSFDKTNK
jgi:hypothetical protein